MTGKNGMNERTDNDEQCLYGLEWFHKIQISPDKMPSPIRRMQYYVYEQMTLGTMFR